MGFQLFLRICHFTKNILHIICATFSDVKFPSHFIALCLAGMLTSPLLHAEPYTEFNVVGNEIVIFADDTFKPAPRDLGGSETQAEEAISKHAESENDNIENVSNIANPSSDIENISSDDLWQRIKNGYAMPNSTSGLTAKHENWYSSRPDYMKRMVERSQKYLFHIVEEVEKRGMPTEIALLPMIESAYNPQAYSTSRASGIWQFVPATGKYFGLKQNWWVDNRRNITFATDAALTYLQKLHAMFGAWDLALAAYNAGEGTVGRAIERNRKLGLPTNYESLNLPPETRNYVPKLQAVKNLMTNPGNYGLNIQTIANTPYFAKVTAPAQIDSRLAARLAEISDNEFLALNPSYNRPVIGNEGEKYELLLPILSAQTFRTNLANYDKPLVSWRTYFAKRGEHIDKIASKFGIQVSQLRNVNNLPAQKKIKTASTILVPNGNRTDFNKTSATSLTPAELNNDLSFKQNVGNIEMASTQDTVSEPTNNHQDDKPVTQRKVTHKVKKGEGLQSIAKRYGVSVKQIMATNSLKTHRVKAGQLLAISTEVAEKTTEATSNHSENTSKKQTYIVKRGDTLHSIAEKFDVAIVDIKRWNKKSGNRIQPGNKLTIMQADAV